MSVRAFVLARLDEETLLPKWAESIAQRVRDGLGMLEVRDLSCLWTDHPNYRPEWRP